MVIVVLNYILKKMGYGHELIKVEETETAEVEYIPLHSVNPNYPLLAYVSSTRNKYGVDAYAPVNDYLPFTPIEYIVKGFERLLDGCKLSGVVGKIDKDRKFQDKQFVKIPPHPMTDLEFINIIQNAMGDIRKSGNFIPYILLSHDDIMLNSATSFNFAKTAVKLSVPLDVIQTISKLSLACDISTPNYKSLYFSLTFIKEANGWLFKNITSANPITLCTPVELFIFAWETMLIDLDHICNRAPVRFVGSKFIDYGHHYNMRTKYDISKALLDVAKLIDMEIEFRDDEFTKVQTFITDYSLNLSSRFSDFKAALLALKDSGSKLEINV